MPLQKGRTLKSLPHSFRQARYSNHLVPVSARSVNPRIMPRCSPSDHVHMMQNSFNQVVTNHSSHAICFPTSIPVQTLRRHTKFCSMQRLLEDDIPFSTLPPRPGQGPATLFPLHCHDHCSGTGTVTGTSTGTDTCAPTMNAHAGAIAPCSCSTGQAVLQPLPVPLARKQNLHPTARPSMSRSRHAGTQL